MNRNILSTLSQDTLANIVDPLSIEFLRREPSNKRSSQIKDAACSAGIPYELLLGIYLIEVACRPSWFRAIENTALFILAPLSFLFKVPLPNYTVGKFQMGIAAALKRAGYDQPDRRSILILNNTHQLLTTLKTPFWRFNLQLAAWQTAKFYNEGASLDPDRAIRYTGLLYNGRFQYSLILNRLVDSLKMSSDVQDSR